MSKSLFAIEALGLETTVSEHFRYLGVLWVYDSKCQKLYPTVISLRESSTGHATGSKRGRDEALTLTILLEDQLALLSFVFVLSTSPVLATLCYTDHR